MHERHLPPSLQALASQRPEQDAVRLAAQSDRCERVAQLVHQYCQQQHCSIQQQSPQHGRPGPKALGQQVEQQEQGEGDMETNGDCSDTAQRDGGRVERCTRHDNDEMLLVLLYYEGRATTPVKKICSEVGAACN